MSNGQPEVFKPGDFVMIKDDLGTDTIRYYYPGSICRITKLKHYYAWSICRVTKLDKGYIRLSPVIQRTNKLYEETFMPISQYLWDRRDLELVWSSSSNEINTSEIKISDNDLNTLLGAKI